jgi:protein-L-isoaspartate(D-aspartate) O-methyltransferase
MTSAEDSAMFSTLRLRMVDTQLRARGIGDQRVLEAMARVPRHEFAPESYRNQAYEDHPLPIGEDQTISQPYIVALMLDALALSPSDNVLEIGTGSGYVTALLAELTGQVVSLERHPALADAARDLIGAMGYKNVRIVVGDGSRGFAESAPYNAIIVSAAAAAVPAALVEQLAEGGRMIIPVGSAGSQQLQFVEMTSGEARITPREMCRFVPLVSENGP